MTREEWEKTVRIELIKRDMTIKELADRCSYSVTHIRKIITNNGVSQPCFKAIEEALGISIKEAYKYGNNTFKE